MLSLTGLTIARKKIVIMVETGFKKLVKNWTLDKINAHTLRPFQKQEFRH